MNGEKQTVLIVEDEGNICSFITTILNANGYGVLKASRGEEALEIINTTPPNAVILDLGLPDMDGIRILKSIREWSAMPIIVVSARTNEKDKVTALDLGADDYVTKPFGTSELLARVRTALRHSAGAMTSGSANGALFINGDLTIDYQRRRVLLAGEDVHLTQNEFKILAILSQHAGRVLTYDFLMKNIWGPTIKCDNQILRVNMANIRRKIEKNPAEPKYVFTEMGVGYRMSEPNDVSLKIGV